MCVAVPHACSTDMRHVRPAEVAGCSGAGLATRRRLSALVVMAYAAATF